MVAKAAAILRARVDESAKPVTLEMGKLIAESHGEVELSADTLSHYVDARSVDSNWQSLTAICRMMRRRPILRRRNGN